MAIEEGMTSVVQYGTVKIENSTSTAMMVFVKDPEGKEHFITTLEPGETACQFTPLGATWIGKPEAVEIMEHVADSSGSIFRMEETSEDEDDDLIGRGPASTTS